MKRTILFFLAALTLLALLPLFPSRPDPAAEVLRLHILANSDSPEDQAVKLRVRDALLPLFETAASYDDARSFVLDHGAALLDRCQTVLVAAGVPYGAQLLLGVSPFPDRTYNGTLFPAGPYDALQIVLGEGAGHNWWCVLFPPLCTEAIASGRAVETLSDGDLQLITEDGRGYVLRFRVLELWDAVKSRLTAPPS